MMVWLVSLAFGGELYAGLPLSELEPLGLGAPTLSRAVPEIRMPLAEGGFAILQVSPTVDEARQVFAGKMETGATRWPPANKGLPGDEAVGDGDKAILLRDRNAVLLVRTKTGGVVEVAERILAALTTDEAVCAPILREEDDPLRGPARWDACGRLRP